MTYYQSLKTHSLCYIFQIMGFLLLIINNLIHGDKHRQNFETPLFITSSDSNTREIISAQRSGLNLFHLLAEWLGIHEKNIQSSCKMISNNECKDQNIAIDFDQKIIYFNELLDDSIK